MTGKKLPVGVDDFTQIRTEDFYYIDKTKLIQELINDWSEVNLFTRPRRFGKTLNMSMLKAFFEIGCDPSLFSGLYIEGEHSLCEKYMGKYPVLFLTLKGIAAWDYRTSRAMLCAGIKMEALRFQFLLNSDKLTELDKKAFLLLTEEDMSDAVLMNSLLTLSALLQKHYGQKVILLIDEYDVPLDKAYEFGYYEEMVVLIRNLFGQALKGNPSLYFAVLTGCLRVSKESIFTGMNHFRIFSVTDVQYDEYFGFTDSEVRRLLGDYGWMEKYDAVRKWYDGYHFGDVDVYCPWDVINYCAALRSGEDAEPQSYWVNSSSNGIIKRVLKKATNQTKKELEQLIEGEAVQKTIYQELTHNELDKSIDHLWSVLFASGYLTQQRKAVGKTYSLVIPNLEIRDIYITQIQEWFYETVHKEQTSLRAFCEAFKGGKVEAVEAYFTAYLKKTISIRDTFSQKPKKENFYHGLLLGLLSSAEDWYIRSNAEAGEGYSDILIEIEEEGIGIIIEVKYAQRDALAAGCAEALQQIEKMKYAWGLQKEGMTKIYAYGIACYKKHCKVELKKL